VTPLILSLEHSPISAFTEAFSGADSVVFSAGAGGKGGPDRTRTVDYEGALKVFDALEALPGKKPHFLLVSSADVRDPDQIPPHWVSGPLSRRAPSRFALLTRTLSLISLLLHPQNIERGRPGRLCSRAESAQQLLPLEIPSRQEPRPPHRVPVDDPAPDGSLG